MGKYNQFVKPVDKTTLRKRQIHPMWRGIGFVLMIVVPVLSYFAAIAILKANSTKNWFPVPTDIVTPWGSDPLIFVKLLLAIGISVVSFMLIFLIWSIGYKIFGPARYGPTDSPPMTREELDKVIIRGRSH